MRGITASFGMVVLALCATANAAGQPVPQAGDTFSDTLRSGGQGPEMVVIPAGRFLMGCVSGQACPSDELPVHEVTIPQAFGVSRFEVKFEDHDRFSHPNRASDAGWGRGLCSAINVSWADAQEYVSWLSSDTGQGYRLLSEVEWEYVARAGSSTAYSWGNDLDSNRANCDGCGSQWDGQQTAPVGSLNRTRSAHTTCTAMLTNGWRIARRSVTRVRPRMGARG